MYLGMDPAVPQNSAFSGQIDDVMFFTDLDLAPLDVLKLFNTGTVEASLLPSLSLSFSFVSAISGYLEHRGSYTNYGADLMGLGNVVPSQGCWAFPTRNPPCPHEVDVAHCKSFLWGVLAGDCDSAADVASQEACRDPDVIKRDSWMLLVLGYIDVGAEGLSFILVVMTFLAASNDTRACLKCLVFVEGLAQLADIGINAYALTVARGGVKAALQQLYRAGCLTDDYDQTVWSMVENVQGLASIVPIELGLGGVEFILTLIVCCQEPSPRAPPNVNRQEARQEAKQAKFRACTHFVMPLLLSIVAQLAVGIFNLVSNTKPLYDEMNELFAVVKDGSGGGGLWCFTPIQIENEFCP